MLRRDPGRPRAQVEARSNRLAHHLVSLGVALGSAVGLLLEPSADAIIAALAVLKAGACYLPLDVASNELLKLMLEVRHGFFLKCSNPCAGVSFWDCSQLQADVHSQSCTVLACKHACTMCLIKNTSHMLPTPGVPRSILASDASLASLLAHSYHGRRTARWRT